MPLKQMNQPAFWRKPGPHKIQGLSAGFIPETLGTDGVIRVTSEQALELGRYIDGKEGTLEFSSAAAIYAAIEVAKLGAGKVLALAPDNGERHLLLPYDLIKNKKKKFNIVAFLILSGGILIFLDLNSLLFNPNWYCLASE